MLHAAAAAAFYLFCSVLPQIPWVDDPERIKAWEESRTGYSWCVGGRAVGDGRACRRSHTIWQLDALQHLSKIAAGWIPCLSTLPLPVAALPRPWLRLPLGSRRIDAIMAQLRQQGWMHHLARHSVACFLTRGDLWCRWGRPVVHVGAACCVLYSSSCISGLQRHLPATAVSPLDLLPHLLPSCITPRPLPPPDLPLCCSWEAGQAVFDKYLVDGDW
jgi:hypothetical protein